MGTGIVCAGLPSCGSEEAFFTTLDFAFARRRGGIDADREGTKSRLPLPYVSKVNVQTLMLCTCGVSHARTLPKSHSPARISTYLKEPTLRHNMRTV